MQLCIADWQLGRKIKSSFLMLRSWPALLLFFPVFVITFSVSIDIQTRVAFMSYDNIVTDNDYE